MNKILFFIAWHIAIKWMIKRNYALRKQGKKPDEWYWLDVVSMERGYFVDER
jgi:hypothetical protein